MKRYTKAEKDAVKKDYLERLKENNGMKMLTCEHVGLNPKTFEDWCKADPEFAKNVEEIRDVIGERCESILMNKIMEGNLSALIFYLKTQRKWSESKNLQISTPEAINVKAAIEEIRQSLATPDEPEDDK